MHCSAPLKISFWQTVVSACCHSKVELFQWEIISSHLNQIWNTEEMVSVHQLVLTNLLEQDNLLCTSSWQHNHPSMAQHVDHNYNRLITSNHKLYNRMTCPTSSRDDQVGWGGHALALNLPILQLISWRPPVSQCNSTEKPRIEFSRKFLHFGEWFYIHDKQFWRISNLQKKNYGHIIWEREFLQIYKAESSSCCFCRGCAKKPHFNESDFLFLHYTGSGIKPHHLGFCSTNFSIDSSCLRQLYFS